MKILFHLGHLAHFHLFKNVIKLLNEKCDSYIQPKDSITFWNVLCYSTLFSIIMFKISSQNALIIALHVSCVWLGESCFVCVGIDLETGQLFHQTWHFTKKKYSSLLTLNCEYYSTYLSCLYTEVPAPGNLNPLNGAQADFCFFIPQVFLN